VLLVVVGVVVRRRDVLVDRRRFRRRMQRRSHLLHDGVETIVIVRRVLDDAYTSVRLIHAVRAVHNVAIPHLVLRLHIAGMGIVYAVIESVPGVRLKQE